MDGYRLGVDTGGTFTDLALVESSAGTVTVHKLPSTPSDPSKAIADGVASILQLAKAAPAAVAYMAHGTTVATNAVLEGNLAKTGLITTHGYRDVIEIARQVRPNPQNLDMAKPMPIVPRDLRLEVRERLLASGEVDTPLAEDEVRACAAVFRHEGVRAVAICFLHSYINSIHEQRAAQIIREENPDWAVSTSSEVIPEYREYERFSTTIMNASLVPVMSSYLKRLEKETADLGIPESPRIMQSNGGIMGIDTASRRPVNTLLSGPSAGVIGASYVSRTAGYPDIITFDMGGTSTDVSLVQDGTPKLSYLRLLDGRPVKSASIDVHSIGAGGGSVGWIDDGGLPHVGPQSAGAVPGPACYGLGGTEPTVTDANVVLGRLNPRHLLGGRMPIAADFAESVIADRLVPSLGADAASAADGVLTLVNANIAAAIRLISVERGYDPRDFTLVAFGGAGGLLAGQVCRELGIARVLIPADPGILCALGLLVADLMADFGQTLMTSTEAPDLKQLNAAYREREDEARQWLLSEHAPMSTSMVTRTLDARYLGQEYEISIPAPTGGLDRAALDEISEAFHTEHERRHGYASRDEIVEITSIRVRATATVDKPALRGEKRTRSDVADAVTRSRAVYFKETGGFTECPVLDRQLLRAGHVVDGPAVVEQMDTTTVVFPGQHAIVDAYRNLIITDK